MLSEVQKISYNNFSTCNPIFADRVVINFFKEESNILILLKAIDGSLIDINELENSFKKHFFQIRFISFIYSIIKFCTIDQIRINQKNDYRNVLTLDSQNPTIEEKSLASFGKSVSHNTDSVSNTIAISSNPKSFHASLANEKLADAFASLTNKQQLITTLAYSMCYQDKEIAKILQVTPQAICKTKKLALQKLRVLVTKI